MENVPNRGLPGPAGGCGGRCTSLELAHGDLEAQSTHDLFVTRFAAAAHLPMVSTVEALVFSIGHHEEGTTQIGVPHVLDLVEFIGAHNWPDPPMAYRLALTLTDLAVVPELVVPDPLDGLSSMTDQRCRRSPWPRRGK